MRSAWAFAARGEGTDTLELDIYDVIGEGFFTRGVTARDVRRILKESTAKSIKVRIHSAGGDVFDGFSIYSQLVDHSATVEVQIDSLAASMASVIAMAGDTITAAKSARIMVHNPFGGALGDADDLRKMADVLDQLKGQIAEVYADRTGIARAEVIKMMADETWMTAAEARERGFVDRVIANKRRTQEQQAAALAALSIDDFWHTPEPLFAAVARAREEMRGHHVPRETLRQLPLNLPAPPAQEPPPAAPPESTMTTQAKTLQLSTIAAIFAMGDTASEEDVLKRIRGAQNFQTRIETETGKQGDAALGTIKAWKTSAEQLPRVTEERDQLQARADQIELDALIEGGRSGKLRDKDGKVWADGKPRLTKAVADRLRAQVLGGKDAEGRDVPDSERISLAAARAMVVAMPATYQSGSADVPSSRGPEGNGGGGQGDGSALNWNGKPYEALNSRERQTIRSQNEALFDEMRADWQSRGCPPAPEPSK